MAAIFLSYRRKDSMDVVGRMYDRLIAYFFGSSIFRDLDSIPLGKPFPEALKDSLKKTSVGLVVIGPGWVSSADDQGRPRLANPSDFVRSEVESLLAMGIPVIPCLVSNARMPSADDLPESIRPLVTRQSISVRSDPDFHQDMNRLIEQISAHIAEAHRQGAQETPSIGPDHPERFTLGRNTTKWIVVDGNGSAVYNPAQVTCRVEPMSLDLPPEVVNRRLEIELREEVKRSEGLPCHWNGQMWALKQYAIMRTPDSENMAVTFTFAPSDYFTFQATIMSLDEPLGNDRQTLRERYLSSDEVCCGPVSFLAIGFGVALVVVTSDNKVLLSRRRSTVVGARLGQLDVSVVEGLHPIKDGAAESPLYNAAMRGAKEELGITLRMNDICYLGFGVDLEFYQWNMLGFARTPLTSTDVLVQRSQGAPDKWEARSIEVVDYEPRPLLRRLRDEPMWSTAWCAIYWALLRKYSQETVAAAVKDVLM
jgi:TIR domain